MNKPPQTVEEAKNYRYGKDILMDQRHHFEEHWTEYDRERCAYDVPEDWNYFNQCSRYNGYGINGLYCKQHAKIVSRQIRNNT